MVGGKLFVNLYQLIEMNGFFTRYVFDREPSNSDA